MAIQMLHALRCQPSSGWAFVQLRDELLGGMTEQSELLGPESLKRCQRKIAELVAVGMSVLEPSPTDSANFGDWFANVLCSLTCDCLRVSSLPTSQDLQHTLVVITPHPPSILQRTLQNDYGDTWDLAARCAPYSLSLSKIKFFVEVRFKEDYWSFDDRTYWKSNLVQTETSLCGVYVKQPSSILPLAPRNKIIVKTPLGIQTVTSNSLQIDPTLSTSEAAVNRESTHIEVHDPAVTPVLQPPISAARNPLEGAVSSLQSLRLGTTEVSLNSEPMLALFQNLPAAKPQTSFLKACSAPGQLIEAGRLQIVKKIGQGCNGLVLLVSTKMSASAEEERVFALKCIFNFQFGSNTVLTRNPFVSEYGILKHTLPPHPNIVRLLHEFNERIIDEVLHFVDPSIRDTMEYNDHGTRKRRMTTFVAMTYYPRTLKQYLTESSTVPLSLLFGFCLDLCEALTHMCKFHVVHLDMKLDNILVCEERNHLWLVVCDFGCAKELDSTWMASCSDLTQGNMCHKAPEILNSVCSNPLGKTWVGGQPPWELGLLIYEIIYGGDAFPDYPNGYGIVGNYSTDCENIQFPAVAGDITISPRTLLKLQELIKSLLAGDPHKRPHVDVAQTILRGDEMTGIYSEYLKGELEAAKREIVTLKAQLHSAQNAQQQLPVNKSDLDSAKTRLEDPAVQSSSLKQQKLQLLKSHPLSMQALRSIQRISGMLVGVTCDQRRLISFTTDKTYVTVFDPSANIGPIGYHPQPHGQNYCLPPEMLNAFHDVCNAYGLLPPTSAVPHIRSALSSLMSDIM
ncbi:Protein kinase domain [Pelomyxa schiedti]|nr:Protein kinase domain [Pelomyxa schiedti]